MDGYYYMDDSDDYRDDALYEQEEEGGYLQDTYFYKPSTDDFRDMPPIDDESVDTRRLRPGTMALLHTSYAVNKSLKRVHNMRSASLKKNYLLPMKSAAGGLSTTSLTADRSSVDGSSSTATDLFSFDSEFQTTRHAMPLTRLDTFNTLCWRIFKHYSAPSDVNSSEITFDSCTFALPIQKLVTAIRQLSDNIPKEHVIDEVNKMHFAKSAMVCWADFREIAVFICAPFLPFLERVTRETILNKTNKLRRSLDPHQRSYQRLLEMQRSASQSRMLDRTNTSPIKSAPVSNSVAQLEGEFVPAQVRDEAILAAVTNDARLRRKERSKAQQLSTGVSAYQQGDPPEVGMLRSNSDASMADLNSQHLQRGGSFDSASFQSFVDQSRRNNDMSASVDIVPGQLSTAGQPIPGFQLPLDKRKIVAIVHPDYAYVNMWKDMKAKRDERTMGEFKNFARKDVLTTLRRLVVTNEREATRNAVEMTRDSVLVSKYERQQRAKNKEDVMLQNISNFKVNESILRKKKAAELNHSLKESVELTRYCIEEDRRQKALAKEPPISLDENSSSIIKIPKELVEMKANAKRYSEYTDAKKRIKSYYEETMSGRINQLTRTKSQRYLPKLGEVPTYASLSRHGSSPHNLSMRTLLPLTHENIQHVLWNHEDDRLSMSSDMDDSYTSSLAMGEYLLTRSRLLEQEDHATTGLDYMRPASEASAPFANQNIDRSQNHEYFDAQPSGAVAVAVAAPEPVPVPVPDPDPLDAVLEYVNDLPIITDTLTMTSS